MVSPLAILAALCLYLAILFLLASWAAQRSSARRSVVNSPIVYSLGLTVLYTSWTFYGSVGNAANIGMTFLVLFLGAMMPLFFWWTIVRKMVSIKNAYKITSIADFISARYDKSAALAALVTIFSMVGVMPYIGLQLKAIISTYQILRIPQAEGIVGVIDQNAGIIITMLMVGFTVIFGVRRLDPTERHPGMVMAIAAEGIVKLLAFLLVGLFITYYMYDGIGDIFTRMRESQAFTQLDVKRNDLSTFSTWLSYLVLAMFAVMFLPRQFHMLVVENSNEDHVRTAMWFLPLYQILLTILVFPIAMGGLLWGLSAANADTFVLRLPIDYGSHWLSITVFVGGVAASSGMIMICAMTMSTMFTNHLLLPLMEFIRPLGFLKRHLLECRWGCVAFAIFSGYFFERTMGSSHMLVSMGLISFAAASQFAPSILGGIFWRKGNKTGALTGLSLGFLVWAYTMIVPALAKSGWISEQFVTNGPLSIALFKPEQLFGLTHVSPIANTVFWSLAFNVLGYVVGSVLSQQSEQEVRLAEDFVSILNPKPPLNVTARRVSSVDLLQKQRELERLLAQYFTPSGAQAKLEQCSRSLDLGDKTHISIVKFADLYNQVERSLAGSVGAAAAHRAMKKSRVFSAQETRDLSAEYANILADLKITPEELRGRVDYYQERERLLTRHSEDLEQQVKEREREIAHRRSVEEKLKRAEEKYRSIFENSPEGIFQTTPEGRFVSANSAMSRMLGYETPEELVSSVTDVRSQVYAVPEDREKLLRSVEGGVAVSGFEAQLMRKDASIMWARVSARPIQSDDGSLIMIEGTCEDISVRKKAEEERARLEQQLRQSQKMEAVGQLAGGFAHDFNNLLQVVSGNTELMLFSVPPQNQAYARIQEIQKAVAGGADLVRRILTFSRKVETSARPLDLNNELRQAEKVLLRTIPKMIRIEFHLADNLKTINADPGQVEQVIYNLAVNAKDAMPDGGKLVFETQNAFLDQDYCEIHVETSPGAYVQLAVTDNGHGMADDVVSRVFEPFFTTKKLGEGTGLGLAMVFGIMKSHGGHVTCYSEPDTGTRFTLYFPATDSEAEIGAEETLEIPSGGTEMILLVDDEEAIQKLGAKMLASAGYAVTTAANGKEALDIYEKDGQGIALVILDLVMPEMGGEKCLGEILKIDPSARVLIASGYGAAGIFEKVREGGAAGFVTKPYNLRRLLTAVRDALDEA